jgi:hypothetical protein
MEPRDRVELRECCVVAYRVSGLGVEFCLITPAAENRWEFPKTSLGGQDAPSPALLEQAATQAGVRGQIQTQTPLGNFAATRGNEAREMTGFLMRVAQVDETWPRQTTHKRLWCLAEEARLRIRRKPLRQFIDVALHSINAPNGLPTNGSSHATAGQRS